MKEGITHTNEAVLVVKTRSMLASVFTLCFLAGMLGGTVSTLMSVYLPVATKDLLGPVSDDRLNQVSAYINSIFLFGWMFGGIVWGIIGDRKGRAKAVIGSTACIGLFTVLTGSAPSWLLVCICRFLSGFGVGGVLVTTIVLIAEVWPEKKKNIAIGILSIAFPVGIFSAGLINYFSPSWRQAFLIGFIPLVIAAISLRVLTGLGNEKDSLSLKKAYYLPVLRSNGKNIAIGSVIFGSMLIGLWAIFAWLPTWVQELFPNKEDASQERGLSMMLLGAGGLTGGFFSGWFAKGIGGLKRSMLVCFAGCFIMALLLFKTNNNFSFIIYIEIVLLALFFGISQGVLSAFIPQLFATDIRAAATGFCFNIGRFFTASAVFFIGALVSFAGSYANAIFLFSFIFLVGLVAILMYKENRSPQ